MLRAEFPIVVVGMATPRLKPTALPFAVRLDYTNYDEIPPSLRFVHPLTEEPILTKNMPTMLPRAKPPTTPAGLPGLPPGFLALQQVENLLQTYGPDEVPFLCIAGVREYHDHPAHTGDAWELHRVTGAGRLVRLLDIVYTYGIEPITDYNVSLQPQIGFAVPRPAQ